MTYKITLTVTASQRALHDKPAEIVLDLRALGITNPHLHIVEQDQTGTIIDDAIPCQLDLLDNNEGVFTFLIKGITPRNTSRCYQLMEGVGKKPSKNLIELTDSVMHEGQESYKITTQNATYVYHKQGAGFASLYDRHGNDWICYHPFGGSDGKYRGIPNIAHPESYFHPGGTGCTSRIVHQGAIKVNIYSESLDGKWACTWDIFPTYARMTVLKVGHPYWFLYEGALAGELDETHDYCVRSNGVKQPLSVSWQEAIPTPEWIYFGSSKTSQVLYLIHHEADDLIDSFWAMEHNMTVFGFGRKGIEKFMTQTPAHFTIGFTQNSRFESVEEVIHSALHPLEVSVTAEDATKQATPV